MYDFVLNHDHKFRTIIVIKHVQVWKIQKGTFIKDSKMVLKHGTLHVKHTTIQKKLKTFGAHLLRKKNFCKNKINYPCPFLWMFWTTTFRTWWICMKFFVVATLKIQNFIPTVNFFWIYSVPIIIFQKYL